jgi:hypothetical protein
VIIAACRPASPGRGVATAASRPLGFGCDDLPLGMSWGGSLRAAGQGPPYRLACGRGIAPAGCCPFCARARTTCSRYLVSGHASPDRASRSPRGVRTVTDSDLLRTPLPGVMLARIRVGVWDPGAPPGRDVDQAQTFSVFASRWWAARKGELRPRTRENYKWRHRRTLRHLAHRRKRLRGRVLPRPRRRGGRDDHGARRRRFVPRDALTNAP